MEIKEKIKHYTHSIVDENNNKWEVVEVSNLQDIMETYAKKIVVDNFCDGSPMNFDECTIEQLKSIHSKADKLVDWVNE